MPKHFGPKHHVGEVDQHLSTVSPMHRRQQRTCKHGRYAPEKARVRRSQVAELHRLGMATDSCIVLQDIHCHHATVNTLTTKASSAFLKLKLKTLISLWHNWAQVKCLPLIALQRAFFDEVGSQSSLAFGYATALLGQRPSFQLPGCFKTCLCHTLPGDAAGSSGESHRLDFRKTSLLVPRSARMATLTLCVAFSAPQCVYKPQNGGSKCLGCVSVTPLGAVKSTLLRARSLQSAWMKCRALPRSSPQRLSVSSSWQKAGPFPEQTTF